MTFLAIGHFFDVRYEARDPASTIDPNSRNISFGLGKKFDDLITKGLNILSKTIVLININTEIL